MTTHIYYHADLDGFASGAIAALGLTEKCNALIYDIYMHKIQYGDPFDPEGLIDRAKDQIIMVDFTLQNDEEMLDLLQHTNMIWIDHHKTSLDFFNKYADSFEREETVVIVDTSKAACELAWEFFFKSEAPLAIQLIGAYDMWKKKDSGFDWEIEVLPFQIQMNHARGTSDPGRCNSINWWKDFLYKNHGSKVREIIESGKQLISFQEGIYKDIALEGAYEARFCGEYNAICLNTPIFNSRVFEAALDVSQYDLMVAYAYLGDKWKVSLYTVKDHVPCGDLSRKLGHEGPYKTGGGHPRAAGFLTTYELLNSYIEPRGTLL